MLRQVWPHNQQQQEVKNYLTETVRITLDCYGTEQNTSIIFDPSGCHFLCSLPSHVLVINSYFSPALFLFFVCLSAPLFACPSEVLRIYSWLSNQGSLL